MRVMRACVRVLGRRWKEERRRNFPSAANVARKEAEVKARAESGALDPQRQERLRRLREVLALQVRLRRIPHAKGAGAERGSATHLDRQAVP